MTASVTLLNGEQVRGVGVIKSAAVCREALAIE